MGSQNNTQDTEWIADAARVIKPGENVTGKEQELVNEIEQLNQSTILDFVDGLYQPGGLHGIQSIIAPKPRIDWQLIGDFSGDRVLDINGGYGGLPHPITRQAKEMAFLSPSADQARFAAEASKILGYDNFTTLQSSIGDLPIEDNSTDHIIINNLIEKTGLLNNIYSEEPSHAIKSFLRDTAKKLSPDGKIYISAENRFNPRNVVEFSKDSIELGRLLPDAFRERKKRGKTFWSERQYNRFLEQTGYDLFSTYYSLDSGSEYTLFPDGNTLTNYLAWNKSQLTNMLPLPAPHGLLRSLFIRTNEFGERFAPGLLIIGSKK